MAATCPRECWTRHDETAPSGAVTMLDSQYVKVKLNRLNMGRRAVRMMDPTNRSYSKDKAGTKIWKPAHLILK
jgi:hypothetical protein